MKDKNFNDTNQIEMLRVRGKRCICKYCGAELHLKRIIFSNNDVARVELYCDDCQRIEFGVEPEIYHSAKYFVDELDFNAYPNLENNEQTRQMSIAKVSEIMHWGYKNLGVLDEHGFKVPIEFNRNIMGETVILTDEDLDQYQEKAFEDFDVNAFKELEELEVTEEK